MCGVSIGFGYWYYGGIMAKTKEIKWDTIKKMALQALENKGLNGIYLKRLEFELEEVDKQGANRYWEDIVNERKKFDQNKHGLLLPWLLKRLTGDADCDPIACRSDPLVLSTRHSYITELIEQCGHLPFDVIQDNDKPDIDIDCLPEARDKIKEYAAERYGINNVASVGTWQTYLLKQALGDAYFAYYGRDSEDDGGENDQTARRGPESLDVARSPAVALTRELPDDINEMLDGGFGVCRGKVRDAETGEERDCGYTYNGLNGVSICSMQDEGVPSEKWLQLKCPVCGSGDTETPTLGSILAEYGSLVPRGTKSSFMDFIRDKPHVIDMAVRLVGRIKHAGKHAGAIIIADRDLFGNVPMQLDQKTNQWVSLWTEGRNTQLSKFGYNKWDILGLKNLEYIYTCCKMVERNHGITFRPPDGGSAMDGLLRYIDPEIDQAGVYWDADGKEVKITLNDPKALGLANESKTDAIFQFDTVLAQQTLMNGVRSFKDLLIFLGLGHPGPMAMIPEYVRRRDDNTQSWRTNEHPMVVEILESTLGILCYQEELTAMWQRIAGFTGPEAQDARKAVAKKWKDKLKPVRQKWIDGAKKHLGEGLATEWFDERMVSFGRYAFNLSHAISYCLWAYKCLWLKAYFPEEWWACVMSRCNQKKLPRYMSASRAEGVRFGEIDINHMTVNMTAHAGQMAKEGGPAVALGLISLKKVGDKLASQFADGIGDDPRDFSDIDTFIEEKGKHKVLFERLIKLGSFQHLHPNVKATWMWYVHKYCTGEVKVPWETMWKDSSFVEYHGLVSDPEKFKIVSRTVRGRKIEEKVYSPITVAQLKQYHRDRSLEMDGWTEECVLAERDRLLREFKDNFPNRKKIPKKVSAFSPTADESRERIMSFYSEDYDLREILRFEEEFLGYYWHSPIDLYHTDGGATVEHAKLTGNMEAVVVEKQMARTKAKNRPFIRLIVNDGVQNALVLIWEGDIGTQDQGLFEKDIGIRLKVEYDRDRNGFALARGSTIKSLWSKRGWNEYQEGELPDGDTA